MRHVQVPSPISDAGGVPFQLGSGLYIKEGRVEEGPVCLFKVELLANRVGNSVFYW